MVAPYNESKLLRIGQVSGQYYFEQDAPTHRHRIPVEWRVTDFPRDLLSPYVQSGLLNIRTLSQVLRDPELFEQLANNPSKVQELDQAYETGFHKEPNTEINTWLVRATASNEDKTSDFLKHGL